MKRLPIHITASNMIFDVIVSGADCFAHVDERLNNMFPALLKADEKTGMGSLDKLGQLSMVKYKTAFSEIILLNAYVRQQENSEIDPDALKSVIRLVKKYYGDKRIGIQLSFQNVDEFFKVNDILSDGLNMDNVSWFMEVDENAFYKTLVKNLFNKHPNVVKAYVMQEKESSIGILSAEAMRDTMGLAKSSHIVKKIYEYFTFIKDRGDESTDKQNQ